MVKLASLLMIAATVWPEPGVATTGCASSTSLLHEAKRVAPASRGKKMYLLMFDFMIVVFPEECWLKHIVRKAQVIQSTNAWVTHRGAIVLVQQVGGAQFDNRLQLGRFVIDGC